MRSNRPTTSQTTCDADDCTDYAITAFYRPSNPGDQSATHNAALAAEGWTDREGRDYCPDHTPTP